MKDIVSINRQYLLLARERAKNIPKTSSFDVITGMSKAMLDRISQLSIDDIEVLATSEINLFSIRISERQLDKIVSGVRDNKRSAYVLASLQMPTNPLS